MRVSATPEETGSRPTRLARTESSRTQAGTKQGGPPHDSLGEVGAMSVYLKSVSVCSDCTFLKRDATRREHFFRRQADHHRVIPSPTFAHSSSHKPYLSTRGKKIYSGGL